MMTGRNLLSFLVIATCIARTVSGCVSDFTYARPTYTIHGVVKYCDSIPMNTPYNQGDCYYFDEVIDPPPLVVNVYERCPDRCIHPSCWTAAPTSTSTSLPTIKPTSSPTHSPTKQLTLVPTKSPTVWPTTGPTKRPTVTHSGEPTAAPSSASSPFSTGGPTWAPIILSTPDPTAAPSGSPSPGPTFLPTSSPTCSPTTSPTKRLTTQPTASPFTSSPTAGSTTEPTRGTSLAPTALPSRSPTSSPTASPTNRSTWLTTGAPSRPTSFPTRRPTGLPSHFPVYIPTAPPSEEPTRPSYVDLVSPTISSAPLRVPTGLPTAAPTTGKPMTTGSTLPVMPTEYPTAAPTTSPTEKPTRVATSSPIAAPSPTYSQTSIPITLSPTTALPSPLPTIQHVAAPSKSPTLVNKDMPSPSGQVAVPLSTSPISTSTKALTTFPSMAPSVQPTFHPTVAPSRDPTEWDVFALLNHISASRQVKPIHSTNPTMPASAATARPLKANSGVAIAFSNDARTSTPSFSPSSSTSSSAINSATPSATPLTVFSRMATSNPTRGLVDTHPPSHSPSESSLAPSFLPASPVIETTERQTDKNILDNIKLESAQLPFPFRPAKLPETVETITISNLTLALPNTGRLRDGSSSSYQSKLRSSLIDTNDETAIFELVLGTWYQNYWSDHDPDHVPARKNRLLRQRRQLGDNKRRHLRTTFAFEVEFVDQNLMFDTHGEPTNMITFNILVQTSETEMTTPDALNTHHTEHDSITSNYNVRTLSLEKIALAPFRDRSANLNLVNLIRLFLDALHGLDGPLDEPIVPERYKDHAISVGTTATESKITKRLLVCFISGGFAMVTAIALLLLANYGGRRQGKVECGPATTVFHHQR